MSERSQVHANLVRPSGIDLYFEQAELAVGRIQLPLHGVMADGFPPAGSSRGHTSTADLVAADVAVDGAALAFQPSLHQRQIPFLHLSPDKLCCQPPMRFVGLRYDDQPAGSFVQTMHD